MVWIMLTEWYWDILSLNKMVTELASNLRSNVVLLVSDNANVMKCTARKLKFPWLGSWAHTLNFEVKDSLRVESLQKLLTEVRAIASH